MNALPRLAALGLAGIGLAGALAGSASAGTTNARAGHFDIEAEVTCATGTNTVTDIEADIDVDEGAAAAWSASTDYVNLGGLQLSGSGSVIGLHPEYVGCTGTPSVTFTLTSASGTGTATATYSGSTRFRSIGSTVSTPNSYAVTAHTDFTNIIYTAAGFYNWTFSASSAGVSDTAPTLTVRAS